MKSVQNIGEAHLCTACGACTLVCPACAIIMEETPAGFLSATVNGNCINCGKCRLVCPSVPENTKRFAPTDLLHGSYLAAFTGHAADTAIRQSGQSGGLVTALLCYLLEQGTVDGAIVAGFDQHKQRPAPFIARNREAVLNSAGSYYTQCPMLPALKGKRERLVAVTLGCQSEALTLLQKMQPQLVPEVTIGLICAGQNSGHMIDDICAHAGVQYPETFRFRDKAMDGWPGAITLQCHAQTVTVPNAYRHQIKPIYECHRCLTCFDQMNSNADIVCGDPWGLTGRDGKEGCTAVLARTEQGLRLLRAAQKAGAIYLEPLSSEELFRGQTVDSRHRDKVYSAKAVFAQQGWPYPYAPAVFDDYIPEQKVLKKSCKKLLYTRAYASAKTAEEAHRIAESKKHEKPPLWVRLKKRLRR